MITLELPAVEQSTYVVTIGFWDESGTPVVPSAASWTLTDMNGAVINARQDVPITGLSTTKDIVLTGDDLVTDDHAQAMRRLIVEATYSSTLGAGLQLREQIVFPLENIQGS